MTRRNRNLLAAAAVAVALALLLRSGDRPVADPAPAVDPGSAAQAAGDSSSPADAGRRAPRRSAADAAAEDEKAVRYLQEQFAATIEDPRTQIRALDKLAGYLQQHYPDDWEQRLKDMLARAFPGMADALMARFRSMSAYNDWLKANRDQLASMSRSERRDALRDARFRYFGDEAAEIWADALRNDGIYDALESIEQNPGTTVDEKIGKFVGAIRESYGDEAQAFLESKQTELLTNFLALEAVQADLHAMEDTARAQQLDSIRRELGLDEEARARWRDLDAERDAAWESGEQYMEERERILAAHDGAEEARLLAELRSRLFDADTADTIRSEEESGFFRFGHRRVYGKE